MGALFSSSAPVTTTARSLHEFVVKDAKGLDFAFNTLKGKVRRFVAHWQCFVIFGCIWIHYIWCFLLIMWLTVGNRAKVKFGRCSMRKSDSSLFLFMGLFIFFICDTPIFFYINYE